MGRSPCCSKEGLNRGAWTASEDKILSDYIKIHGEGGWRNLPSKAGLKRCGKSCRLRWLNYLRPDIKRGNISHDEEELIIRLHRLLGNRWSLIAGRLPGRTDNEIKNYWNSNLAKKVQGDQLTSMRNKNSNQSKEKKKPIDQEQVALKVEPQVVRTKALRCTKVFFGPQTHNIMGLDNNMTIGAPTVGDFVSSKGVELNPHNQMLPLMMTPREENPDVFAMDFNIPQLSEFDNVVTGDVNNNNNNNDSLRSSDQLFLFTDEMPDDWRERDCAEPDISSDLQSLALFLDTEGDWLS